MRNNLTRTSIRGCSRLIDAQSSSSRYLYNYALNSLGTGMGAGTGMGVGMGMGMGMGVGLDEARVLHRRAYLVRIP